MINNATNLYGVAKWIVDPVLGRGTHTTIAAALSAASSGDTIFIRPATYTENLTLKAGVNLTAFTCDAYPAEFSTNPNVIILGKCTSSYSGSAAMSGIQFKTNGDYCIVTSGNNVTYLTFVNCSIIASDHTAINHTGTGGGLLYILNCQGKITNAGITFFNMTANAPLRMSSCYFDHGSSATNSTISSSTVQDVSLYNCLFGPGITGSNSGIIGINNCHIGSNGIVVNGTSTVDYIVNSFITTEASGVAAISIGAGATCTVTNTTITSSAANVMTGAGTLQYALIAFTANSGTNVTTQTALPTLV